MGKRAAARLDLVITSIKTTPLVIGGHVATCSCGWQSMPFRVRAHARAVESQHALDHQQNGA